MPDTTKAREILNAWLEANGDENPDRAQVEYAVRHLERAQNAKIPFANVEMPDPKCTVGGQYKYLIWSNEDAGADYECAAYVRDDPEEFEDMDEATIRQIVVDYNANLLEDERSNLNCNGKKYDILAITEIQLWNGTRIVVELLQNVKLGAILQLKGEDTTAFYGDGKDILARRVHHDGTNRTTFKILNRDKLGKSLNSFMTDLFNGGSVASSENTETVLNIMNVEAPGAISSVWPEVANVYGWPLD